MSNHLIKLAEIFGRVLGLVQGLQIIGFTILGVLAAIYDPKPWTCLVLFLIWWLPTGWFLLLLTRHLWFGR